MNTKDRKVGRAAWEHLKPYGHAPGHYTGKCRECDKKLIDQDKRSWTCRECAEKMLRKDAERYRWLCKNRDVLLLTGFFGNGCINRTIDEVHAAIDESMAKT